MIEFITVFVAILLCIVFMAGSLHVNARAKEKRGCRGSGAGDRRGHRPASCMNCPDGGD